MTLPERTDQVFHGHLPALRPGQVYGLRAHGPWDPARGHRFNPAKLLLDPYARAVRGRLRWEGPNLVDPAAPFALDPRDSAPFVPKAVITTPPEPAGPGPDTPWEDTILYEAHVKGLTKLHPAVPDSLRGTYAGLTHPAVLDHLVRLGITAVELMPVAAFLDEHRLVRLGLANYWGYNSLAFMAPEPRYAHADPQAEFQAMVRALHAAGLEVILDVVFNHTAETDHLGPTLSLKGLDNAVYYRLRPDDPGRYQDVTGCGNTLNLAHPRVLQLVLDALRHWAALGVDGFRFDLAPSLGRDRQGRFDPETAFFQALAQDPVLGRLKLVAEPWDVGPDGYRLGGFPPPFSEWNDRFRDTVRRFWRGDEAILPELAGRLVGSASLFESSGRGPRAGINYVTAHDGFTLQDLVSFERKHNEANGEDNRDGHGENLSVNHGIEGPSQEIAVRERRDRHRRNLLATLLFAQGTPMLLMGDEFGRTQAGNNNAYCQDNPISWCHWEGVETEDPASFLAFVQRITILRRQHAALRRRRFLHGRTSPSTGLSDIAWLAPDGSLKSRRHWQDPTNRCFGLFLGAHDPAESSLLLLFNASAGSVDFVLPTQAWFRGLHWRYRLDTTRPAAANELPIINGSIHMAPFCTILFAAEPPIDP